MSGAPHPKQPLREVRAAADADAKLLGAEMHAFAFKNIFPRISRVTTSEQIELK